MNQPQQPRPYSGAAVYTATTFALVAATAALAALVGVAGALWLRQRQWATDASSSSSADSGSRGEPADDDGDMHGEDAADAHEEGWVQSGLLCPQHCSNDLVCQHCCTVQEELMKPCGSLPSHVPSSSLSVYCTLA